MSNDQTRQRYALATGKGLDSAPGKTISPGMAKGGKAKSKPMLKSKGKKTSC